jgi:DNA repair protein RAD5
MDADSPPQGLFFAGSDDGNDNDDVLIEEPLPGAATPESESKPRLFFADSDDDEETHASTFTTPMKRSISVHIENDGQSSDVEIPSFEEIPRASSVSSFSSALSGKDSSPAPYIESREPPTKRMRMSSPFTASQPPFESIYIGSFIVSNAWSTVRGKGYIKSGDEIHVEREDQVEGPSSGAFKKGKKGKAMDKGKMKQLSIANMMKAPQSKMSKKKTNTVVRLTNSRGFGIFCFLLCYRWT